MGDLVSSVRSSGVGRGRAGQTGTLEPIVPEKGRISGRTVSRT